MQSLHIVLILTGMFLISCSGSMSDPIEIQDDTGEVTYELVTGDIQNPWGMAFLPNGDILVTEKKGEIRVIRDGALLDQKIEAVPKVHVNGQGGLMDIALHPDYGSNGWIYITYSSKEGGGSGSNTALMRAKLIGMTLVDQEILYKGSPNTSSGNHYGSRIAFDQEGFVYFSIGDRHNRNKNPQDITRDGGKIYRLHDNGKIPDDNPFVDKTGAKKAIYSYGHRNPQGMAMNPADGKIWTHEHGPQGGDEVNIIQPGKNYGWPIISYGINYNGSKFAEATSKSGMEQPVIYWVPSIAPCGMTFVEGDKYPDWSGDLLVGSLKFNYVVHCKVDGDKITSQEKIAYGIGRVRNVKQAPDGTIYVGVEGKGIFKLVTSN